MDAGAGPRNAPLDRGMRSRDAGRVRRIRGPTLYALTVARRVSGALPGLRERLAVSVGASTAALLIAGCSCAASHVLDADATGLDAFDGDASSPTDAGTAESRDVGNDVWICDPTYIPSCTDDDACQRWAQSMAPAGTIGVSRCSGTDGGTGLCLRGSSACMPGGDRGLECTCDGVSCTLAYVCVADAPGGPSRCALACDGF